MMKRILFAAALLAALPCSVSAQVEKRVEVTKAYVPSVESAAKLAVVPDMTDTVKMRPEIDYTITPLSLQTTLATRPIRPATVTYWEFNRPLPFYLKAGAGYPLNSVLDFYASSQNPGTGYVVGYVNHEGRYAKIKNDFGIKNNSTRCSTASAPRPASISANTFWRVTFPMKTGCITVTGCMSRRASRQTWPPAQWPITAMRISRCVSATIFRT